MLIITNGSSAVSALDEAEIPGEKLSWDDVLHDGPVPDGLDLPDLSRVRARFIADCRWGAEEDVRDAFQRRDARLAASQGDGEVVLWFEHDLYDQLQLLQLLDWFGAPDRRPPRLTLICRAAYVSLDEPDVLREAFDGRIAIADRHFEAARHAWAAFRAPTPTPLAACARHPSDELPFLAPAFRRLLEEYPGVRDGLARTERQLLSVIRDRPGATRGEAFVTAQPLDDPVYLGDASFFRYLDGLRADPAPLLTNDEDGGLQLTKAGHDVLAGRLDRIRLRGIERWYGGVRLTGGNIWRWNGEAGTIEAE